MPLKDLGVQSGSNLRQGKCFALVMHHVHVHSSNTGPLCLAQESLEITSTRPRAFCLLDLQGQLLKTAEASLQALSREDRQRRLTLARPGRRS